MAAQLPPELWQEIIELVCDRGHGMSDMHVREDVCALQRTCRLFYDVCTPIIYENVYVQSKHGYDAYMQSLDSTTRGARRPYPRVLCLLGFTWPRSLHRSSLLSTLPRVKRLALFVGGAWGLTASDLSESIEEYAGHLPLFSSPESVGDRFDRLQRLCLIDAGFENSIEFCLSCPNLRDVVLMFPFLGGLEVSIVVDRLRDIVRDRRSDPRITVLNALAKTIDNPGFSWIQRSNTFLDDLARSIHMVDLQLYRHSADHEGLGSHEIGTALHLDESPFSHFVEKSVCEGSLYDYCRAEGRRCGQATGLGLALVPW